VVAAAHSGGGTVAAAARQHDFFLGYLGGCFEDCFGCRFEGLKYCFWKV